MGEVDLKEFERVFGFVRRGSGTTEEIQHVAVLRRLQELAQPWGGAHDRLTELRARYDVNTNGITRAQAVKDFGEAMALEDKRHRTQCTWEVARNIARAAGFVVAGDIKVYYRKEGAGAESPSAAPAEA